jgi:hypothetical protein
MSKGLKITLGVLVSFVALSFLHLWLNIGFDKLGFTKSEKASSTFRVGFLPVT